MQIFTQKLQLERGAWIEFKVPLAKMKVVAWYLFGLN